MLSFRRGGHRIARVSGGDHSGKYVSIFPEDSQGETVNPASLLTAQYFKKLKSNITQGQINAVVTAINDNNPTAVPAYLNPVYKATLAMIEQRAPTEIYLDSGEMLPAINDDPDQSDVLYIAGPQGSGKSRWTANYIRSYRQEHPTNDIFLFSQKDEDKELAEFEDPEDDHKIKRVPLTVEFWLEGEEEPFDYKNFKRALLVFDDIDAISEKKLSIAVNKLRDQCIKVGRSNHTDIIITGHQLTNYSDTRQILMNSNRIIFFPRVMGQSAEYYMKTYKGFGKEMIKKIRDLKSRWVELGNRYPGYAVFEHGAFLTS